MDELTKLYTGLSTRQKLTIALTLLVAAAAIVGLTKWKHESDFRTLYSSMAPEDTATVVQKLKETGVEYRLLDNGSGVMVPSAKVAEARLALAAAGLPKTGRIGFELFDKTNFGATELVEHINYQRALEGELERSIMAISEVEMARVHITLTKESVFLDQQQPAKASVMVKLHLGMQVSPQNVVAISHLVASAVQGLSPSAVSILDTDGHLLSRPIRDPNDGSQATTEMLELRQQLERDLVAKINLTLEPLLGADRFRAGAFVDCDLTSAEQQEETLDPTKSVMVTSQKTEDVTSRTLNAGVPGTASNLPHPTSQSASGEGEVSRRTENVNYETSRLVRKTRIPQGIIKRVSVSVLVGQEMHWEGAGKSRHRAFVPPSPETLKSIKDLVAGVTGITPDRGDQLIVDSLPFEAIVNDVPEAPAPGTNSNPTKNWKDLLTNNWSTILIIVVGLGVAMIVSRSLIKRPQPDRETGEAEAPRAIAASDAMGKIDLPKSTYVAALEDASTKEEERILDRVCTLTEKDLSLATAVVRSWLHEAAS